MPSEILKVLSRKPAVAVVGLSRNPEKYGRRVAKYLKEEGLKAIPVNPNAEETLNEKSYRSLLKVPGDGVEIVNVFKPPDAAEVAKGALKFKERERKVARFLDAARGRERGGGQVGQKGYWWRFPGRAPWPPIKKGRLEKLRHEVPHARG